MKDYVYQYIKEFVAQNDYEFADNFRAYRIGGSEEDMQEYQRRQDDGCCGYYDQVHTINGEQWMIGFNYGH